MPNIKKKRSPEAAKDATRRLDRAMQAIFKAHGETIEDSHFIHRELRKRINLFDALGLDPDMVAYSAEHEQLRHWLRDRKEPIAPMQCGKARKGRMQRSYQHDGKRYIHLIAILAEATRDPQAEDADERREWGREIIKTLVAHYKALGGPYMAQAALLENIDAEVEDKSVIFKQQELLPEEFTA